MQRFVRILLGSAAAMAVISGATVLSTTAASAQFNIEGLIRGALAHGNYGGGRAYRHRGRVHEAKHEHHSKGSKEARQEDKGKQEDKADKQDKQSAQANQSNHANQAEDKGPAQSTPPANATTPKQPVATDVPPFSPSR